MPLTLAQNAGDHFFHFVQKLVEIPAGEEVFERFDSFGLVHRGCKQTFHAASFKLVARIDSRPIPSSAVILVIQFRDRALRQDIGQISHEKLVGQQSRVQQRLDGSVFKRGASGGEQQRAETFPGRVSQFHAFLARLREVPFEHRGESVGPLAERVPASVDGRAVVQLERDRRRLRVTVVHPREIGRSRVYHLTLV